MAAYLAMLAVLALNPAVVKSDNRDNDIASTLKTTAPDLARFTIELMNPKLAPVAVVERLTHPSVVVNDRVQWGLGIGIDQSDGETTWWHWGSNPGYQSLMVVQPDRQRAGRDSNQRGRFRRLRAAGPGRLCNGP